MPPLPQTHATLVSDPVVQTLLSQINANLANLKQPAVPQGGGGGGAAGGKTQDWQEEARERWKKTVEDFKQALGSAADLINPNLKELGSLLGAGGQMIAGLRQAFSPLTGLIKGALGAMVPSSIRGVATAVSGGYGRFMSGLTGRAAAGAAGAAGGTGAAGAAGAAGGGAGAATGLVKAGLVTGTVVGGIAALAAGTVAAVSAMKNFTSGLIESNRALAQFSPSQAVIAAQADVRTMIRGMKMGEATAGSSAQLSDAWQDLLDTLAPIQTVLMNLLNDVGTVILEQFKSALEFLASIRDVLLEANKLWNWFWGKQGVTEGTAGPRGITMGEWLTEIANDTKRMRERGDDWMGRPAPAFGGGGSF